MNLDLFSSIDNSETWAETICPGAVVLRQYVTAQSESIWAAVQQITQQAPFRQMQTPGGHTMSVALSSCGEYGWVSDRNGYRYSRTNPQTGQAWPLMPESFRALAQAAALEAGFPAFEPDACLINRYTPGSKMGLHQDKDERDFSAPIVSVSLGVPATFQFGGMKRSDTPVKIPLAHGDVVVWGGEARLRFHGVLTIRQAWHPLTGHDRINLTFRKAC
jgi:alkylated DNA repair protein (DNA oxidative demethylase)